MAQTRVGVRRPSLWDGLLAYYRADGTPNDQLGNYNGTLINGTTYGSGKINQGFDFDGVNDYIQTVAPAHNFSTPTTYNVWVKPDALLSTKFFIYVPINITGPAIGFINGGFMTFFTGAVNGEAYTNTRLDLNVWNMMTVVFKGNSFGPNNVDFYKNGVFVQSKTKTNVNNTQPTIMRFGGSGSNLFYDGMMDEIGIWSKELTSDEILQLYNSGNGKQK